MILKQKVAFVVCLDSVGQFLISYGKRVCKAKGVTSARNVGRTYKARSSRKNRHFDKAYLQRNSQVKSKVVDCSLPVEDFYCLMLVFSFNSSSFPVTIIARRGLRFIVNHNNNDTIYCILAQFQHSRCQPFLHTWSHLILPRKAISKG